MADEVYVQLPWGVLLEGIVLARDDVLGGIAALCRPGARVVVTLNGEIWLDSTPARYEQLPVPTPEYVAEVIAPRLRARRDPARGGALLDRGGSEAALHDVGAPARPRSRPSVLRSVRRRRVVSGHRSGRGEHRAAEVEASLDPAAISGASVTEPPCSFAICSTIASPRPDPGTPACGRRPVEAIEHVGQVVGIDAGAPVEDLDVGAAHDDLDRGVGRAELQRVVEQVA